MRNRERGSAMLVTLILIAALLAGAAVLVSMQLASNRSTETAKTGMTALYCAEAGLSAARSVVKGNHDQWAATLLLSGATPPDLSEPGWLSTGIGSHDLDGDGNPDFEVYIVDNDDEAASGSANDPTIDKDSQIFIVSKCKKYPDMPKTVKELIRYEEATGTCYESQEGGCSQAGNTNTN